jgi:hypothetical protein
MSDPLRFIRRKAIALLSIPLLAVSLAPTLSAQQARDEEYGRQIRQFTTESFFLTPLVDHLPAHPTIPTPLDILGRIAGAADVLSYPEEVYGYMRAVAESTPRVQVWNRGTSEEGREFVLVAVSSEANMAAFEQNRAQLARLADPRGITDEEAAELARTTKPVYWATGAIHSPETGSPEMLMELVYRLAASEDPFIRAIRDNMIVLVTPVVEPDGRAKVVDLAMAPRKDPQGVYPERPLWWGQYVAHSNNRDGMGLSLNLTRSLNEIFLEHNPTVLHDLHESASYLYTSTGRGPYNPNLDPVVINEWNRLAYLEVGQMTAWGVPGIYTYDFYDGWAPNYVFWMAHLHNSIGRFYETQAARDGGNYLLNLNVDRQWHRPNTPLQQVVWSLRNNVNLQQSAILLAMHEVATHSEEFLQNFHLKGKRSVAKARTEGPAAYVLPSDDPRPGQQARLLQILQRHGFEVHRADRAFTAGGTNFPAGSWVLRLDQPYARGIDILLDTQYYNADDPFPYDDTGWTHGPLYNAVTVRVEDVSVLDAPMTLVRETVRAPGGVAGPGGGAPSPFYLVHYNADNNLAAFRFAHPDLRIHAARADFQAAGRSFGAGSFILRASENGGPEALAQRLNTLGAEYGFFAHGVAQEPSVATHEMRVPRIAVMHTWVNTQDEGWMRIALDEYGIPYDYVSVHEARDNPALRDRYDVIIMGPAVADAMQYLNGLQGPRPIPWKATEITPNIGRQNSTDDMRGGLELEGILNLRRFVEAGGVFITVHNSSVVPIQFGLAPGVSIRNTPNLWARGGVFRVTKTDALSPIAYGYGDETGVHFSSAPVFAIGGGGFGGGAAAATRRPGDTTARASGRGGVDERDIPQGRPRDAGQESVARWRAEEEAEATLPSVAQGPRPRAIVSFHGDPTRLLISGGLKNGQELAGAPALVDVPVGDGNVVLFSFKPFWRSHTAGSYAFLFNTLLHAGNLNAGSAVADQDSDR